jgi:hypothetical protein
MLVKIIGPWRSLAEELACAVADQFMNSSGEKSHNVRSILEELELGGVNPVTGNVRVIVYTETIRENNVLEAMSLSDVFVL